MLQRSMTYSITPGPIASPQDLSLGKSALSTIATFRTGFNFLYAIAVLVPAGPAPIITTSYCSKEFITITKTNAYWYTTDKLSKNFYFFLLF